MRNKIAFSLIISTFLSLSLVAENEEKKTSETDRIQMQQAGGKSAVEGESKNSNLQVSHRIVEDYADAIYAEYIFRHKSMSEKINNGKKVVSLVDNITEFEKNKLEDVSQSQINDSSVRRFYTRGYCSFLNTVNVSEMISFAEVECILDGIGRARLALNIHPQHSAKALVAKAIYLMPDGVNQANRLFVEQGVVLNGLRTGLNIASIINDRKIERMLAAGLLGTNKIASSESLRYMDALEQSKQNESSEVIPGTGGSAPIVIQSKNTEAPDAADYLTIAGIRLVSSLVGVIGESMINDLPYLYLIEKGQRIYFDGLITSSMPNPTGGPVRFSNKSIVNKTSQEISVQQDGTIEYKKIGASFDDTRDMSVSNPASTNRSRTNTNNTGGRR